MEVDEELRNVRDAASLRRFIEHMRMTQMKEIGDPSLSIYFDQMAGFLMDSSDDYLRRYMDLPPEAWRMVGDIIYSAQIYD